ncbi:MAG: glycosyltransferase [Xanthomonadales bacterium]|nr:glycosyltransferase [Xanthomonadales bacterium]
MASDRALRVLHLGKHLPPHPGGMERFVDELMPALSDCGIASAALVHADAGRRRSRVHRQATGLVVRAGVWARMAFTPISPAWPCWLSRLLARWRPQVLHLHLPNPSAFWALLSPSARRLPWLVHWHADVPEDALDWRLRLFYRLYQPLERAVLRRAAVIVATSQAYAGSSKALATFAGKVRVVPLGLPDRAATGQPLAGLWPETCRLRVLFVGRFSYYKGLNNLVEALSDLPDVAAVLVGDGDQLPALKARIEILGLAQRIRLAGRLDDEELARAYAAADVLCLPSIERSEAFGLVLLEAMRAGVATIATTVPGSGMAEVVGGIAQGVNAKPPPAALSGEDEGETRPGSASGQETDAIGEDAAGLLVPPGDVAALRQALARLRDDPALRQRLARQGRERFRQRYDIASVARGMAGIYRELANG